MYKLVLRVFAVFVTVSFVAAPLTPVYADSFDVSARIEAPLPPDLPVIINQDNTQVTTATFVVTGTCYIIVPNLIVVLERDKRTIGSGVCSNHGTFSISISLVLGVNIIRVKFMTITGQSGGYGTPLTIMYSTGATVGDGKDTSTRNTPTVVHIPDDTTQAVVGPLAVLLDYDFVTYTTTQETPITIGVSGGVQPYKVFIGWGDGSSKALQIKGPDNFIVRHFYRSVPNQPMKFIVRVVDAQGTVTQSQRALVTFEKIPGAAALAPALAGSNNAKVLAIWFTATVGMMLLSTLTHKAYFVNGAGAQIVKKKLAFKAKRRH